MVLLTKEIHLELDGNMLDLRQQEKHSQFQNRFRGRTKLTNIEGDTDSIRLTFERTIGRGIVARSDIEVSQVDEYKIHANGIAKVPLFQFLLTDVTQTVE
ncbi:MAG: hypothetical protein AAFV93_17710 [Chloroflexota bacterium]